MKNRKLPKDQDKNREKEQNKILPQKTAILKSKTLFDTNSSNNINNTSAKNKSKNYSNNILKKCQIKYNSFIKEHRDITLSGTKRYEDKSGEYYLQNLEKFQKNLNPNQKSITSLNLNSNNNNANDSLFSNTNYHSNKYIIKVRKKKLCDELIPLPHMKHNDKIKNDIEKKNLYNAMDNAKYLRRYQYSNNLSQKQIKLYKEIKKSEKIFLDKVKFIQIWWKTIFQIIKIQKYLRGYLYRIKLISLLDKREKYIDKVLHFVKSFKKIFLYKYFKNLFRYNNYKKYYFSKWKDIIYKQIIIKKIFNKYSGKKADINMENMNNDLEQDFDIYKTNDNYKNKSLIEIYNNSLSIQNKKKKQKNLSSSSFILRPRNNNLNNLNIGAELSSSQILKKRNKISLHDINQTNYNKKIKSKINNKKVNIFEHLKKDKNQYNSNNNANINKTNIKERYLKEKSFNDLKSNYKTNYKTKNNNNELTKSTNINSYNNNVRLSLGLKNKNLIKSKKNLKKKKMHKFTQSDLSNNSSNIFNKKKTKQKKIKVYENKLNYYKKFNSKNIEKEILSLDKEKSQPYTESIFDESQFSAILDNSTLNNDKNTINFNNEKKNINHFIESPSLIDKEGLDIKFDANNFLKNYFKEWTKKTICKLLIRKCHINKSIIIFNEKISYFFKEKNFCIFINKCNIYVHYISVLKFNMLLDDLKMKIFVKELKNILNKIVLLKYFKCYKDIVDKKIIVGNIVENKKRYVRKKNKAIKKRNQIQLFYSDCDLGNNNFITEIPFNNYNNNFINNNINLNNNTNNCYIINNLNYNANDNTNKINIGLTYENDYNNNYEQRQNNINSLGIMRQKIINYPKNIYKQKKLKQSLGLYNFNNNTLIRDDLNSNNIIDNCNLFNYNMNSKMNNNKTPFIYKHNLSKSVIIPNNLDINYLKPDITTQKNQLTMVINLMERHRKSDNYNLFLSLFKKWKNIINYNIPSNLNINMRNKNNSFKNINNNFSGGTTDLDDLTKNTITTEGFRTESDSKSENKITIKSLCSLPNSLGVYKKKTIGNASNKILNHTKGNNINNTKKTNNACSINKMRLSCNILSHNYNYESQENMTKKDSLEKKFDLDRKPLSDKNLNYLIQNNDNTNNNCSNSPAEYFGFKKNNKIEEMEICFFPLDENKNEYQLDKKDNIKKHKYLNSFDNEINLIEKNNEYNNETGQKEIIIEAIEEYNEYEGDNENLFQIIKNEFTNEPKNALFRTFTNLKRNDNKEDIKNKSMNNII